MVINTKWMAYKDIKANGIKLGGFLEIIHGANFPSGQGLDQCEALHAELSL